MEASLGRFRQRRTSRFGARGGGDTGCAGRSERASASQCARSLGAARSVEGRSRDQGLRLTLHRSKLDAGATWRIGPRTARQAGSVRGVVVRRSCPSFVTWLQKSAGVAWPSEAAPVVAGVVEGGLAVRGKPQAAKRHRERASGLRVAVPRRGASPPRRWKVFRFAARCRPSRGGAGSGLGRRLRAGENLAVVDDDGDTRSLVTSLSRGPNRLTRSARRQAEAGLGRVNGSAHLGASRGHHTKRGCSSLTCGLQKSAGRIFGASVRA